MTPAPSITSDAFHADPYAHYQVLRDEYPLLWDEPTRSYVISRYTDVARAFREPTFTTQNYSWQLEPVHGRTILQMDGREHSTHRALITPAFRGKELETTFRPVIERNAGELIDELRGHETVDLVAEFGTWFPIKVIVDMLGLPREDHARFHRWYTSVIAFLSNLTGDPGVTEDGLRTREELAAYLLPIIRDRRANPGDDLLSRLCTTEVDGATLSDEDIRAFVSLLLAAGGETTDKAIGSLFAQLLQHPDQFQALYQDRSLVDAAFAETLRYNPPVVMIMRVPSENVELSGGTVPAGSTVTCIIGAANRDPRQYANPDRFDIHRSDLDTSKAFSAAANHLAFALGRHFCVGALLAQTEVRIGVNMLLDELHRIRPVSTTPPQEKGLFTRGPVSVPVTTAPPTRQ